MIGHSLEAPVSEEEFLRRELGVTWHQVEPAALADAITRAHANGRRTVVICSEPDCYGQVLAAAPPDSVVLILISDEGYSRERRWLVQRHAAVHSVYRQYPAHPAGSWAIARAAWAFMLDAHGTTQAARTALPNAQKGRGIRMRMQDWSQVATVVHDVPLGYTHAFVDAFLAEFAPDADGEASLFSIATPSTRRPISITFRGNRGLAARIVGMERAARLAGSDITTIDADWSGFATGDVGRTYVDALSHAKFALCPPGFVNNESFRFYEALLCGALPVELDVALTHQGRTTTRRGGAIHAHSWRAGLRQAERMDESTRARRVASARTLVAERLRDLRSQLATDAEG